MSSLSINVLMATCGCLALGSGAAQHTSGASVWCGGLRCGMDVHGGETAKQLFWDGSKSQTHGVAASLGPQDHTALGYVVVSQNRGTPIWTPKCYSPYYGTPQKGTLNFGNPPYRDDSGDPFPQSDYSFLQQVQAKQLSRETEAALPETRDYNFS